MVTASNAAETSGRPEGLRPGRQRDALQAALKMFWGTFGVALDSFEHVPSDGGAAAVTAFESGDVAMACAFGGGVLAMLAAGGLVDDASEQEAIGIRLFDIISIPTQFGIDHGRR